MRRAGVEPVAARDVERDRQPTRRIGAEGAEAFGVGEVWQSHRACILQTVSLRAVLRDARFAGSSDEELLRGSIVTGTGAA